jgi:hypothetical protein
MKFEYKVGASVASAIVLVPHIKAVIHGRDLHANYHLAWLRK